MCYTPHRRPHEQEAEQDKTFQTDKSDQTFFFARCDTYHKERPQEQEVGQEKTPNPILPFHLIVHSSTRISVYACASERLEWTELFRPSVILECRCALSQYIRSFAFRCECGRKDELNSTSPPTETDRRFKMKVWIVGNE